MRDFNQCNLLEFIEEQLNTVFFHVSAMIFDSLSLTKLTPIPTQKQDDHPPNLSTSILDRLHNNLPSLIPHLSKPITTIILLITLYLLTTINSKAKSSSKKKKKKKGKDLKKLKLKTKCTSNWSFFCIPTTHKFQFLQTKQIINHNTHKPTHI